MHAVWVVTLMLRLMGHGWRVSLTQVVRIGIHLHGVMMQSQVGVGCRLLSNIE